MKHETILEVKDVTVKMAENTVLSYVSFKVEEGECLAVAGASGSGKSTLLRTIAAGFSGKGTIIFHKKNDAPVRVIIVLQQHYFKNLSNTSNFYYQQRFNSADAEDALMVRDVLQNICSDIQALNETLDVLGIAHISNKRLIQLSNGEHKRFQLAKAILQNPDWILLDSPYTGLDAGARKMLNHIIEKLIAKGIHILLVTSFIDMPCFITHVAVLNKGVLKNKIVRKEFDYKKYASSSVSVTSGIALNAVQSMLSTVDPEFAVAVKMIDTSVIYNNKKILDSINWKVNKGECWSVSGHNGSGKSTLLSLITGDNPQAFANEIYLFDKKKGSGETIWDIKQKIGFVSPELHHYFDAGNTCFDVVASGLFDTIGLFKKINTKQILLVKEWMSLLQIISFEKRLFKQLSNGEQRLVLLARALIKNPPLLILDEPCQGLDDEVKQWFVSLINDVCTGLRKTLIYVSHYEEEIPCCVTHSLKLDHGKIAA